MRKGSVSCLTRFGIKLSAEDCNLEILRLQAQEKYSGNAASLDKQQDVLQHQGAAIATPTNLLLSTPLRFLPVRDNVPSELLLNTTEANIASEEVFHPVHDLLEATVDLPGKNMNSSFLLQSQKENFGKKNDTFLR